MEEFTTIPKKLTLPASQDYEYLRSEGLKHIENLSSAIWTDYNAHDPGITILEALCYAITELGYRCGFDITDFLHTENGTLVNGQTLYTAKNILTINPLTINDYRKLLVDIEGVHNAWLIADDFKLENKQAISEVEIFADCKNDVLTTSEFNDKPLYLSGLYQVLLDLDYDDQFGDLNNGKIIVSNPSSTNFYEGEFVFSINFPAWKDARFDYISLDVEKIVVSSESIDTTALPWVGTASINDVGNTTLVFYITISKKPGQKKVEDADIQVMFTNNGFVTKFVKDYLVKIKKAKSIVQSAIKSLQEHRNLCEDFIEVTTIDDDEIAFCFDVDVNPAADIEKIQAEIFYAIENYLNPSIDFYSLKELLDEQIPVDEIFTGPVLQHGFIDTEQLEQTNLRSVLHASDIINLLMDIEGVQAIRNFLMRKPANSKADKWCLKVKDGAKPVLSTDKSKIILFKNQFPFLAQYSEVHDTILVLHAIRSRSKLNGLEDDLPVPAGNRRDTESYWPLQYDFPQTYGIGQYGLPSGATPLRTAQQRQLKAYLMFYEQLLADFFSQLSNAHHLFSTEEVKQTYYAQFLKDIKDVDVLYNTSATFGSLESILSNQDATVNLKNGWQSLFESKEVFEDRRNRFLDHLLSRFAESFNDYALLIYRINYEDKTEEKISFSEISAAKRNTLANYPAISRERGKAFNYFPQQNDFTIDATQLWDTKNVSGLEKRISFLAGFENYTRRSLSCIKQSEPFCIEEKNADGKFICVFRFMVTYFELNDTKGDVTEYKLTSVAYDTKSDAEKAIKELSALTAENFPGNFTNAVVAIQHPDAANPDPETIEFNGGEDATALVKKILEQLKKNCNDSTGLHLIEHILLRPREKNIPADNDFDLMQVCLNESDCPCEMDPYTFRASVVLPASAAHFSNMAFRKYFENKIREEAPAHVMLKICWLSNELMQKFELYYKNWIIKLAEYYADKINNREPFRIANNLMIAVLAKLHSEYPEATLHDCIKSKEGSNTVLLGKTVLGTFKNL